MTRDPATPKADDNLFDQMLKSPTQENTAAEEDHEEDIDQSLQTVTALNADAPYGTLAAEARRALVTLLKQGVILGAEKRLLFDAVCKYEIDIRHQLANLYLELMLDHRLEVAVLVQKHEDTDTEGPDQSFIKLIQTRPLTLFDSLVILVLRKHYQQREAIGETRTLIELDQIAEQLVPFLPITNNESLDRKRLNAALEKLKDNKIITRVRGDSDRVEITPVIRFVIDSSYLSELEKEYRQLGQPEPNAHSASPRIDTTQHQPADQIPEPPIEPDNNQPVEKEVINPGLFDE